MEVRRREQLLSDRRPVVRGGGRAVGDRPVVVDESQEPGFLETVRLGGRGRGEDPLMEVVRQADLEEAWAIRWTVDTLISAGTKMVGGGFFAPARPQETFRVTLDDPDCAQRGVTEFRHHLAMPHGMFQRIAERRGEYPTLRSASIHVLAADDRLIENA